MVSAAQNISANYDIKKSHYRIVSIQFIAINKQITLNHNEDYELALQIDSELSASNDDIV